MRPPGPCAAALGVIGVPARRWLTRAELYGQLERAKAFMDRCDLAAVTLADCASQAGVSLHHFSRLFHEVNGVTPHQYLSARRVCEAKRLLQESSLSVAAIAVETGYESGSAFGRMFRVHAGCSPTAFRAAIQQDR